MSNEPGGDTCLRHVFFTTFIRGTSAMTTSATNLLYNKIIGSQIQVSGHIYQLVFIVVPNDGRELDGSKYQCCI